MMSPTALMTSYSGNAVDALVVSESSPTMEWIAPLMPQQIPTEVAHVRQSNI